LSSIFVFVYVFISIIPRAYFIICFWAVE
jgi:hypothetical protein